MPRLSTSVRNALLGNLSALTTCDVYTGTIPATGDTAPTGTKLATFTIALATPTGGATIAAVPVASDAVLATGTAGYARIWNLDDTESGWSLYCSVGVSSGDLRLSSLSFTVGGTRNITQCRIDWPAS